LTLSNKLQQQDLKKRTPLHTNPKSRESSASHKEKIKGRGEKRTTIHPHVASAMVRKIKSTSRRKTKRVNELGPTKKKKEERGDPKMG